MSSYAKTVIMGNLGKDPESRTTPSGTIIASFSVATSRRVKKGETWEEETQWYRCKAFGKTAENLVKFKKKGESVLVEGHMEFGSYENKDGQRVNTADLIADHIVFVSGGGGGRGLGDVNPSGTPDDDLPF